MVEPYEMFEECIWEYHKEGISLINAIKWLHKEYPKVSFKEATELVLWHPAYSGIYTTNHSLHEQLNAWVRAGFPDDDIETDSV
jgi:hypothetical protein